MTATLERRTERLIEYASSGGGRVDRAANVIRNVKIIGTVSKNGREYPMETLRRAAEKYEGAKVNIDHPDKGKERTPRSYESRFGILRNVTTRATGLYGDLHFNPKHPMAEQFLWDAEHSPEAVGLSHNIQAATTSRNGRTVVEDITQVVSVDVVADPATTGGLFESVGPRHIPATGARTESLERKIGELAKRVDRLVNREAHEARCRRSLMEAMPIVSPSILTPATSQSVVRRSFLEAAKPVSLSLK